MKNKIAITSLALFFTVLLSGCGDSAEGINEESQTTKQENIFFSSGGNESTAPEKTENQMNRTMSEEKSPTSEDPKYGYYDLLDKEYEQCSKSMMIKPNAYGVCYDSVTKNVIICRSEPEKIVVIYNIETKSKVSEFEFVGYTSNAYCYCDGVIWVRDRKRDKVFGYSIYGDLVGEFAISTKINGGFLVDSNKVFFTKNFGIEMNEEDEGCFMFTAGSDEGKRLPELKYVDKEGVERSMGFDYLACYKNKLYVCGYNDNDVYCLDTDTLVWTKVSKFHVSKGDYFCGIGRFLIFRSVIYDMENGELVACTGCENFGYWYRGGLPIMNFDRTYCLVGNEKRVENLRYEHDIPYGGKKEVMGECEGFEYNMLLDDKYYLYNDRWSWFLREYEKGEKDEVVIYLYEKE